MFSTTCRRKNRSWMSGFGLDPYPSLRQVTYSLDGAGRLSQVQNGTAPTAPSYASGILYTPHDAIQQMTLGDGVTVTTTYSADRLQPTSIVAAYGGAPLLTLGYSHCASGADPCTNNNGNVLSESIAPASGVSVSQYYIPGGNWTPQVTADDPTQVAAIPPGNRWTGTGVQYDNGVAGGVGNLTGLPGFAFGYDAENRQALAAGGQTAASYGYDGEGRRVLKVECPAGTLPCTSASTGATVTTYVYDASGELAAEYSTAAGAAPCTTCYLTADQLGSTRMMTDGTTGAVVGLHDYLPFGEEIPGGKFGRGSAYDLAGPNQKFTGKERDAETGLDYFGARYMSSAQGRFTSPDPIHIMPQKLLDPQQWNMYAYVRNNPLRLIDPTGMYICNGTESECKDFEKARQRDLKSKKDNVRNAADAYGAAGTDNGVNVGFGDPGQGHGGNTTVGLRQLANGNWQATADVIIRKGTSGNALDSVLGHEGVHVENAQDFAKTITGDFHYDLSKNLTHWQTEMNAYAVTAAIDPGHSYGTCGTGQCVLGSGMSARAVAATTMMLLANPANVYNRFIDAGTGQTYTGQGSPVNVLGMRQFSAITDPNPR